MRYVKWILAAIGVVIAYKVYLRLANKNATVTQTVNTDTASRQPGMVSNLLDDIAGAFSFGENQATPTIVGPFGKVGVQTAGSEPYVATNSDTRIPSFLQGMTGGVQDPAMPGSAPPAPIGPAPAIGGSYYPAQDSPIAVNRWAYSKPGPSPVPTRLVSTNPLRVVRATAAVLKN